MGNGEWGMRNNGQRQYLKKQVGVCAVRQKDLVSERWKVRIFICQFFPSFGIIEFLFIKMNQNCCFAGYVSDDNVKDHEVISLSTGWCIKIRISLSTVTSSVIIKTKSKCLCILTF